MTKITQHDTKQINNNTEYIDKHQRHDTTNQTDSQHSCMNKTHNHNSKQEAVMHKKMHYIIKQSFTFHTVKPPNHHLIPSRQFKPIKFIPLLISIFHNIITQQTS